MKKFLIRLIVSIPVFLVVGLVLLLLLGGIRILPDVNYNRGNYGHLFSRAKEASQTLDVDVLFLGSSHCYRTFDTRYFDSVGLRSFNFGSSNQTPIQTLVLLQDYLATLNPRLVVMEVHPDVMMIDGVESAVDMVSNVPITRNISRMALQMRNLKVFDSWLYALMRQTLFHDLERYEEPAEMDGFVYVPGGFCYPVKDRRFGLTELPSKTIEINPDQVDALQKCLDLVRENGIPVLMVQVPDSRVQTQAYTNLPEFQDQISRLGDYLVLPPMPGPDSLYYYDECHLNAEGVAIANQMMLETLSNYLKI